MRGLGRSVAVAVALVLPLLLPTTSLAAGSGALLDAATGATMNAPVGGNQYMQITGTFTPVAGEVVTWTFADTGNALVSDQTGLYCGAVAHDDVAPTSTSTHAMAYPGAGSCVIYLYHGGGYSAPRDSFTANGATYSYGSEATPTPTPAPTEAPVEGVQDVRVVGYGATVQARIDLTFMTALAFGSVFVVGLVSGALAILTRRGS